LNWDTSVYVFGNTMMTRQGAYVHGVLPLTCVIVIRYLLNFVKTFMALISSSCLITSQIRQ